ncbi:hypothetical protein ACIQMV_38810 [Streptomyces sp. NPDC091412]
MVIPVWDCTLGTPVAPDPPPELIAHAAACLDTALRRIGGAPAYVLMC